MSPGNMGVATRSVPPVQKDDPASGIQSSRPFHKQGATEPLVEVTIRKYTLGIRSSFDGLDKDRISALLVSSFGKRLVDAEAYFAAENVIGIIIEKDYRGIAIVKNLDGVNYLDKLAVVKELQGNGLGGEIWQALKERYPSLIWRASNENPINPWYMAKSDGHTNHGEWIVYWYGMSDHAAIGMVEKIGDLPKTLIKTE